MPVDAINPAMCTDLHQKGETVARIPLLVVCLRPDALQKEHRPRSPETGLPPMQVGASTVCVDLHQ